MSHPHSRRDPPPFDGEQPGGAATRSPSRVVPLGSFLPLLPTELRDDDDGPDDALALPVGQSQQLLQAPDSARSAPADWTSDAAPATPIAIDASKYGVQSGGGRASTSGEIPSPPALAVPVPSTPIGWQSAPTTLNLVPYKPFSGSVSGGGKSFFYRSPTPNARQRTNQACEKCRDRKTKCSGDRPACVRCSARGLICEYAPDPRTRGHYKSRKRNAGDRAAPTSSTKASKRSTRPFPQSGLLTYNPHSLSNTTHETAQTNYRERLAALNPAKALDHGDPANYQGGSHLGLQGAATVSRAPPHVFQGMHQYQDTTVAQHGDVPSRDKYAPVLRVSTSMPQLKPGTTQPDGFEGPSRPVYSTAGFGMSLVDFIALSGGLQSRCSSTSSTYSNSNSHSSAEVAEVEENLEIGMSSAIEYGSWSPPDPTQENEDGPAGSGVYQHGEGDISTSRVDDNTPRPPSHHQFNPSEWIHGEAFC